MILLAVVILLAFGLVLGLCHAAAIPTPTPNGLDDE